MATVTVPAETITKSSCCDVCACEQDLVQCCLTLLVPQSLNLLMLLFFTCKARLQYHL